MLRKRLKNSAFTMIEATMAMVLLAIAAAGILMPFGSAVSVQEEAARQTLAANLASEMMEKVLVSEPNDMLGTYGAYQETKGAMLDTKGSVLSDFVYGGFSRTVASQAVTVQSVPMVLVTVTVAYEGNEMTRIMALKEQ